MEYLIKGIKLENTRYIFITDKNGKPDFIENLSKLNIFVGENNSGKTQL